MARRFVIGIDDVTAEQKQALRNVFKEHGSWWNWIPNFWLVTTGADTTTSYLRDRIGELVPGVNCMVIEADDKDWSGYGPATERRDMFKWVKRTWELRDDD
jgi:hypothetical protein